MMIVLSEAPNAHVAEVAHGIHLRTVVGTGMRRFLVGRRVLLAHGKVSRRRRAGLGEGCVNAGGGALGGRAWAHE